MPVKFGTCSWKYDSWKGLIYPEMVEINELEEYAKSFNSVEIDQWFWSLHAPDKITLPKKEVVKKYNESTPDDFKFTIKVPNSLTLTHFYKKKKTDPLSENDKFLSVDLFNTFWESISEIHSKVGSLIFQFEYLNKQKMSSLDEFINRFNDFKNSLDQNIPIAIETRNPNYLKTQLFEFMKSYNIAPVLLEGYFMPSIVETGRQFYELIDKNLLIRLHGPDRKGIETRTNNIWNEIVIKRDEELNSIIKMINYFASKGVDIYVNVNNHFEGSAPLTIQKILPQIK